MALRETNFGVPPAHQLFWELRDYGLAAVRQKYYVPPPPHYPLRISALGPKDPALPDRRDGVVYKIPCGTCDKVYIGETGRPVGERMLEHRRDVRLRRTDNSAVAEHAWDSDHPPNWDEVRCIAQDKHLYTRRVKEAIQIRLHPNNINRDNGIDIPEEWLPTIRRHDPPSATNGDAARSAATPTDYSGSRHAPPPRPTGTQLPARPPHRSTTATLALLPPPRPHSTRLPHRPAQVPSQ